jgi:hypothetical protein
MNKFLTLTLLLASASLSQADIMLIDVFSGNDSEAAVETALGGLNVTLYDKSDDGSDLAVYTGNNGVITNSTDGTWDVIDNTVLISYITVKAGPNYSLWAVNPALNSGGWTTAGLAVGNENQPNLSHLSLWTAGGGPGGDPVIPEPMTIGLFGGGLLALGLYRKFVKA